MKSVPDKIQSSKKKGRTATIQANGGTVESTTSNLQSCPKPSKRGTRNHQFGGIVPDHTIKGEGRSSI